MSRLDRAFLLRSTEPEPLPIPATPAEELERRNLAERPSGPMADLITELRAYQAELEAQNKVLRYSESAAVSASERFGTLLSSVPLALMVPGATPLVVLMPKTRSSDFS